jgi:hypothetical protein
MDKEHPSGGMNLLSTCQQYRSLYNDDMKMALFLVNHRLELRDYLDLLKKFPSSFLPKSRQLPSEWLMRLLERMVANPKTARQAALLFPCLSLYYYYCHPDDRISLPGLLYAHAWTLRWSSMREIMIASVENKRERGVDWLTHLSEFDWVERGNLCVGLLASLYRALHTDRDADIVQKYSVTLSMHCDRDVATGVNVHTARYTFAGETFDSHCDLANYFFLSHCKSLALGRNLLPPVISEFIRAVTQSTAFDDDARYEPIFNHYVSYVPYYAMREVVRRQFTAQSPERISFVAKLLHCSNRLERSSFNAVLSMLLC